jgi:hypothetical protein
MNDGRHSSLYVRFRFESDPVDTIRYYETNPTWDEKSQAFVIIPSDAFPNESIILID